MTIIGYHASHEQFSPSELLQYVRLASDAGFEAAKSSDHFHPWSERQAQSGFAWAWLGAAMQATNLPFGTIVAPGYRYHPAIVAQAAATLAEMFPQRFWLRWVLARRSTRRSLACLGPTNPSATPVCWNPWRSYGRF
ncbi:MAG: LLM class flavin-dependent oxidoreductase [Devosia sp.]